MINTDMHAFTKQVADAEEAVKYAAFGIFTAFVGLKYILVEGIDVYESITMKLHDHKGKQQQGKGHAPVGKPFIVKRGGGK